VGRSPNIHPNAESDGLQPLMGTRVYYRTRQNRTLHSALSEPRLQPLVVPLFHDTGGRARFAVDYTVISKDPPLSPLPVDPTHRVRSIYRLF